MKLFLRKKQSEYVGEGHRDSSFELFRIITMMVIISSHYVSNSGIIHEITEYNVMAWNSVFSLLFGFGGKTGINCFVLISGYFMCKSTISLRKLLKLLLEIEFYRIGFFLIFLLSGYTEFAMTDLWKAIFPFENVGTGFIGSYLVFFLFIPFLNALLKVLNERNHIILIGLSLIGGSVMPTFFQTSQMFTYVGWFMVLYFIAAYIRIYPRSLFENKKIWFGAMVLSLILAWCSVFGMAVMYQRTGVANFYYFVKDVHKMFAVTTSITAFLFFKTLHLKYHPIINKLAASSFGVYLIHANSASMQRWLWKDTLKNVEAFHSDYLILHAVTSVVMIYLIASSIDMLRIRFVEKPFLKLYDKHNIEDRFVNWWNRIGNKINQMES